MYIKGRQVVLNTAQLMVQSGLWVGPREQQEATDHPSLGSSKSNTEPLNNGIFSKTISLQTSNHFKFDLGSENRAPLKSNVLFEHRWLIFPWEYILDDWWQTRLFMGFSNRWCSLRTKGTIKNPIDSWFSPDMFPWSSHFSHEKSEKSPMFMAQGRMAMKAENSTPAVARTCKIWGSKKDVFIENSTG